MKFYFPDSQDQIDPNFKFVTEERELHRVRQRDDLYAHEVFTPPPFDGLLISKAIVDGRANNEGAGKYTAAQRQRLYDEGATEFFRLGNGAERLPIMGDCGAFSYFKEEKPPYTVTEVIDFYVKSQVDFGISVDHLIFEHEPSIGREDSRAEPWLKRQKLTLDLAADFWRDCKAGQVDFTAVGVAQGWNPDAYQYAVKELQKMGYERIAMGGLVPRKTPEILDCLRAVDDVRLHGTQLHLLGINRPEAIRDFASLGVTSFDSTSPFLQSFKDARNNYHLPDSSYVAIRVPQVDGNRKLRDKIMSGEIPQNQAIKFERDALNALRRYGQDEIDVDEAIGAVAKYNELWGEKPSWLRHYHETLTDRPWRRCECVLCRKLGIEIIMLRGTERNKSRGFHNLYTLERRLRMELGKDDR